MNQPPKENKNQPTTSPWKILGVFSFCLNIKREKKWSTSLSPMSVVMKSWCNEEQMIVITLFKPLGLRLCGTVYETVSERVTLWIYLCMHADMCVSLRVGMVGTSFHYVPCYSNLVPLCWANATKPLWL